MIARSDRRLLALLAAAVLLRPTTVLAEAPEGAAPPPLAPSSAGLPGLDGPLTLSGPPMEGGEGAPADLGRRPGGLALPVAETLAINLVTMGWNRYVGRASWADVTLDSVGTNLRSRWVLDDNAFFVNQVGHPYQGTWSFTAARSAGLGFWGAVPFAFGASAAWELAGETERPALNDQVTTTVGGVVLGEILHRFAGVLRAEGGAWREALAAVLSPMGALNQRAVGYSATTLAPPSRWQLSLGALAVEGAGARGGWEPLGHAGLSFVYGLPGANLPLERPFDHFVLEASYGAAADPVVTARARGLLGGRSFELDAARGLFGLFLSFDLDTPPRHQVSTSAVGLGGSARAELGAGLAVEADAVASAVLLGAGSRAERGPDAGDRDYRFGPGEQALLALRLDGPRASAGFALRQYLLFGAGADAGSTELLLEASASAVVRIARSHGVGVELSRHARRAQASGEPRIREVDSVVRVYYALLGGVPGRAEAPEK
jgi:hypothetical protein